MYDPENDPPRTLEQFSEFCDYHDINLNFVDLQIEQRMEFMGEAEVSVNIKAIVTKQHHDEEPSATTDAESDWDRAMKILG